MLLVFFIVFLDTVVKPRYDSDGTPRNDVFLLLLKFSIGKYRKYRSGNKNR
ncbi:MAG TPA: palindromic element RPE4 domain-containing protein [Rickettsia endosymbiont of Bembidion lapponicum]|nr:palindromic element RPE4 domain-containing protein [Rickettsia endosymbiont of Bembidion lapponicum]